RRCSTCCRSIASDRLVNCGCSTGYCDNYWLSCNDDARSLRLLGTVIVRGRGVHDESTLSRIGRGETCTCSSSWTTTWSRPGERVWSGSTCRRSVTRDRLASGRASTGYCDSECLSSNVHRSCLRLLGTVQIGCCCVNNESALSGISRGEAGASPCRWTSAWCGPGERVWRSAPSRGGIASNWFADGGGSAGYCDNYWLGCDNN